MVRRGTKAAPASTAGYLGKAGKTAAAKAAGETAAATSEEAVGNATATKTAGATQAARVARAGAASKTIQPEVQQQQSEEQ